MVNEKTLVGLKVDHHIRKVDFLKEIIKTVTS